MVSTPEAPGRAVRVAQTVQRGQSLLTIVPLQDVWVPANFKETQFAQVHRSVVVNLHSIAHVTRNLNETADIHLKGRPEVQPVSRNYLHVFKQM